MENFYLNYVSVLIRYVKLSIPPGPKNYPLKWGVNLQKCSTFFFLLALMTYYQNFSLGAYTILALHGVYGFCWIMKDWIFPDPSWEEKATLMSIVNMLLTVLGPYWYAGFHIISENVEVTPLRMCFCVMLHTLGVVIMMAADTQKYFVLKVKRGLISDGWFAYVRNPNYLGEIMLYSTYAILAQSWIPWIVYSYVWGLVFVSNMISKEVSIRSKEGGEDYIARSGFLIPSIFDWLSSGFRSKSNENKLPPVTKRVTRSTPKEN